MFQLHPAPGAATFIPTARQTIFCLRPSAKDLGVTRVVIVLFLLSQFLPHWDSNRGPSAPQPSALSTEPQKCCYT